mmetsp:Transcript_42825/g.75835  ORF Transcript_42825/g.75835 Transcript_42825/m.75835 type:complete len:116 (+) Transcript_42825:273-620(+)
MCKLWMIMPYGLPWRAARVDWVTRSMTFLYFEEQKTESAIILRGASYGCDVLQLTLHLLRCSFSMATSSAIDLMEKSIILPLQAPFETFWVWQHRKSAVDRKSYCSPSFRTSMIR